MVYWRILLQSPKVAVKSQVVAVTDYFQSSKISNCSIALPSESFLGCTCSIP